MIDHPPTRNFRLGHVLSITTGILCCEGESHPIDGIYKILDFMTGDSNFTHQLPRLCKEAAPVLLQQHPRLVGISGENVGPHNVAEWLTALKAEFGDSFAVTPMSQDEHEYREPLSEAVEYFAPDKIIIVTP